MLLKDVDSYYNDSSSYLNIAAICPSTKVLGPGNRFVIWLQGCCFNCRNCGSPEWRPVKKAHLISPESLVKKIIHTPEIEGITISGGEPLLQVRNLLRLLNLLDTQNNLSIIAYTGFVYADLLEKGDPDTIAFLEELDVLIDGPYREEMSDGQGLRGSSNQQVHFLSGRYHERRHDFIFGTRERELHVFNDHCLLVGLKPRFHEDGSGEALLASEQFNIATLCQQAGHR